MGVVDEGLSEEMRRSRPIAAEPSRGRAPFPAPIAWPRTRLQTRRAHTSGYPSTRRNFACIEGDTNASRPAGHREVLLVIKRNYGAQAVQHV
jgi:hypothetical protein